jgi:glycosyltransferase involved in cell wall biosynthesis
LLRRSAPHKDRPAYFSENFIMMIYFPEKENPRITSSGGIMSYIRNLSEFLISQNINTTLIGYGSAMEKNSIFPFTHFIRISDKKISNIRYFFTLFTILNKIHSDNSTIIHCQRPYMLLPFLFFKKKAAHLLTLHGRPEISIYHKKGIFLGLLYLLAQRYAFRQCDCIITVNEQSKAYFEQKYPVIKNKIKVVPIGINTKIFRPLNKNELRKKYGYSSNDKIIINVGRLESEKNIAFLIESCAILQTHIENLKLLLIGNGSEKNKLQQLAKNLNFNAITFLGDIENDKVPELLNCADVFAFCSLYEGNPTVIKEALSCNVPVVSVDVGNVKEIIDTLPGCYCAPREVNEFALTLKKALESTTANNLNAVLPDFSYEAMGKATLELYRKAINEKNIN